MREVKNNVVEIDAVIFPVKFGKKTEEKVSAEPKNELSEAKERISVDRRNELFSRLKKSLRKKSAAIL